MWSIPNEDEYWERAWAAPDDDDSRTGNRNQSGRF